MEPILKQLRELQKRVAALSAGARMAMAAGAVVLVLGVILASVLGSGATYQYAFTNLGAEDSSEAASQLKAAGIPFRLEAGGTALSVPASQVYDARLLLAAAGLPRGGGVGFELFDRGDLGVSEFTQRVNLRRAIEGELGRTIGKLAAVRAARVHLTLPEKGLYRDEDRKASAAVVVTLQPGRSLADREIQGVRHLVASAVPGLDLDHVTVMDGRGAVLAGKESLTSRLSSEQSTIERSLEGRVIELLEAAVGPGGAVAKVTATLDTSEVETTSDTFDPEGSAVRSERRVMEQTTQEGAGPAGVAGAAANQPLTPAAGGGTSGGRGGTNREDELKNYEISKTVTRSVTRAPRVKRLSVAVLVDGVDGKPRPAADIARLAELAKSAVGFEAARGDKFEISSSPFNRSGAAGTGEPGGFFASAKGRYALMGAGLAALLLLGFIVMMLSRARKAKAVTAELALIKPGKRVGDAEKALTGEEPQAIPTLPSPVAAALPGNDPNVNVRDKARELAGVDPARAAKILKAWIDSDHERREAA